MKYIFGPVLSRRLGVSLGIDLLPEKVCSFDCIYCECGKTEIKTLEIKEWVPAKEVMEEIKEYLSKDTSLDFITITGSGEPTLHSKIGEIIDYVKKITSIPVAVLTNGSLLHLKEVRESLYKADVVAPSLNAVTEKTFRVINRSFFTISPSLIIDGLIQFRKEFSGKIWLEIVFVKGINDNMEEIKKIAEALEKIQPDKIHLNTVIRPPTEKWAKPLSFEELEKIKECLGEKTEIVTPRKEMRAEMKRRAIESKISEIAKRRPVSREELSRIFYMNEGDISKIVESLLERGILKMEKFEGTDYFITR